MKISIIQAGFLKLDGGAMFGVVPKRMWAKTNPPDENNLCTWSMRCLLVQDGTRNILIDTGIGTKQGERFRSHFEPSQQDLLFKSLAENNLTPSDITDVLLTHLHFDHVGGALHYDENAQLQPTFPNATYWTNERQWQWAMQPNPREAASFLKENFEFLQKIGIVSFLPVTEDFEWLPNFRLQFAYGHTEAMMLPTITLPTQTLIYCADLIPSSSHIGLPYVMGYDIRPLNTISEKEKLLEKAAEEGHLFVFEHDPTVECATVRKEAAGRFVIDKSGKLTDFL